MSNSIMISGPAGSGKSTIALIIKNALLGYGIQCSVVGEDTAPGLIAETLGPRADTIAEKQIKPVEIEMVQTTRPQATETRAIYLRPPVSRSWPPGRPRF